IVLFVQDTNWRMVFVIGALPAVLVFWIRRSVKEPERWQQAKEEAVSDATHKELGNIFEMFSDPILRLNTIAGVLLAIAGVRAMHFLAGEQLCLGYVLGANTGLLRPCAVFGLLRLFP